jgi:hypothetical protein
VGSRFSADSQKPGRIVQAHNGQHTPRGHARGVPAAWLRVRAESGEAGKSQVSPDRNPRGAELMANINAARTAILNSYRNQLSGRQSRAVSSCILEMDLTLAWHSGIGTSRCRSAAASRRPIIRARRN